MSTGHRMGHCWSRTEHKAVYFTVLSLLCSFEIQNKYILKRVSILKLKEESEKDQTKTKIRQISALL